MSSSQEETEEDQRRWKVAIAEGKRPAMMSYEATMDASTSKELLNFIILRNANYSCMICRAGQKNQDSFTYETSRQDENDSSDIFQGSSFDASKSL
jgi:hypothetical protein